LRAVAIDAARYKSGSARKCLIRNEFFSRSFFVVERQPLDFSGASGRRSPDVNKVIHKYDGYSVKHCQINDLAAFPEVMTKL